VIGRSHTDPVGSNVGPAQAARSRRGGPLNPRGYRGAAYLRSAGATRRATRALAWSLAAAGATRAVNAEVDARDAIAEFWQVGTPSELPLRAARAGVGVWCGWCGVQPSNDPRAS